MRVIRNSVTSSKNPGDELVVVPCAVIDLAERLPGVVFHKDYRDVPRAGFINDFLKPLPAGVPTTTAILFQGGPSDIGTMVAEIEITLWSWGEGGECARISLAHQNSGDWLRTIGAGVNFWSPFILAIARVKPGTPVGLMGEAKSKFRDYTGEHFVRVVEHNHV